MLVPFFKPSRFRINGIIVESVPQLVWTEYWRFGFARLCFVSLSFIALLLRLALLQIVGFPKNFKMLAFLKLLLNVFQFFSYCLATYTFFKSCVLPVTGLVSSLARNLFSSRNPEVHWHGRVNSRVVCLVSPASQEGPLLPLVRRADQK